MRRIIVSIALALAASTPRPAAAASQQPANVLPEWHGGVISSLGTIATIGSTMDALNRDGNPYGLTIAPKAGGSIAQGDLVVCNFNDGLNIQGLGTTIELLSPVVGSNPRRLIADPRLTGCAAIAMGGAAPWVAALDANDNPIVSPQGAIVNPLNADTFAWTGPWGQAFVSGPKSPQPAFYESNANDGSIVRINLGKSFTFDTIATGFPVNHGVPGSILAPSGLTYDAERDVLYVVDGAVNALVAIRNPATIHAGGIVLRNGYVGGSDASRVKVLFHGTPLNAPISAALLFNGDIVVGNTGDNRLIEFEPTGRLVGSRLLDKGAAGALFGIVASGSTAANTRIYFNDDNDNTVKVLSR
jgi:hypothetical protein